MNSISLALRDSTTMFRRDIRHSFRNFAMTLSGIITPLIMLVLFVYVFGGAMGASLGGISYINYVAPAVLIMTVASGCATTAVNLVMDMNEGIITRFRTMAISPASVLTGQVLGSLLRTMVSACLLLAVALLLGFRPTAGLLEWVAALGVTAMIAFAITWVGVVFGLVGRTPAGANSLALLFQLLAFTSSAFVRPETMPEGIRWFAEYQPFTPVIETLRGLFLGTPVGNNLVLAVIWCAVLSLVGFVLSRAIYNRGSAH